MVSRTLRTILRLFEPAREHLVQPSFLVFRNRGHGEMLEINLVLGRKR